MGRMNFSGARPGAGGFFGDNVDADVGRGRRRGTRTRHIVQFAVVRTSELKANSRRRRHRRRRRVLVVRALSRKRNVPVARRCRAVIGYLWSEIEVGIV